MNIILPCQRLRVYEIFITLLGTISTAEDKLEKRGAILIVVLF